MTQGVRATAYKPEILNAANPSDRKRLAVLNASALRVVDELQGQFEELYKIRHPDSVLRKPSGEQVRAFITAQTGSAKIPETYGVWGWYPWTGTLVHFLPEELHTELRTARNRNLISADEQEAFYTSRIGVAGLSVGNSAVASIVHTGGGRNLHIADADVLSGSNTNRIRCGFDMVGLPKCTVIAREVYALNPYASVEVFPQGITTENLRAFLTSPDTLDLVIDEMDDLYLKIRLRLEARTLGIPVIMAADNGDGIVVDIERFDRDSRLPLMHGDIPETELLAISPDTPRPVAARIISSWVRPENIADRMKTSLLELGKTLYTWPQLGNAAFMAGAMLSYVARKVVVGDPLLEGKCVITPDAFFVPGFDAPEAIKKRKMLTDTFKKAVGL